MARATATAMKGTAVAEAPDAAEEPLSVMRAATDYLGPARVVEVAGSAVSVTFPNTGAPVRAPVTMGPQAAPNPGAPVRAMMALAFPYRPAPGDTLLVVGREGAFYVIGVLQGTGETQLSFAGGVELRAEGGPLRLVSDQAVEVQAPEVSLDAGRLRLFAEAAVQKLGTLYQHVRGLHRARAGASETIVDEGSLTRAKSAAILTEEAMTINGKQIHLG